MKRRCVWASSRATTSSRGSTVQSSHGERSAIGAGRSGVPKTSSATMLCIHVVPCFVRVLITTSPSRSAKPSHRPLSSSDDVYRYGGAVTTAPSAQALHEAVPDVDLPVDDRVERREGEGAAVE